MRQIGLEEFQQLTSEQGPSYQLSEGQRQRVSAAYSLLEEHARQHVVYGINTGFGPMAQYSVGKEDLNALQYNLIRSHACGSGEPLSDLSSRAVMTARLHSLALGRSGCSLELLETFEAFLAHRIHPLIFEHGGVGASGDLVQLAHLGLGVIGEGECYYQGQRMAVSKALSTSGISAAKLRLRDGLAIINGTSCMTAIAALNTFKARNLLSNAIGIGSHLNELVESFHDHFSETLNAAKMHHGQQAVAAQMRQRTSGSKALKVREEHDFVGNNGSEEFNKKVQEYYSLRCLPQILGPIMDTLDAVADTVEKEINSASDNPIIDVDSGKVLHGGNFHGDVVSFEMDKLKIATIKLTMLLERQLNFLLNNKLNERFPPFLNAGTIGLNYGLQGMQFTATSTTAENQALATSMYAHSIPCNNDNQDIVSMGTNSALLAQKTVENCAQVMGILLLAIAQATDLCEHKEELSPAAKLQYQRIRAIAPMVKDDLPHTGILAKLKQLAIASITDPKMSHSS